MEIKRRKAQDITAFNLKGVLSDTRSEYSGISIYEVAGIIKDVYDEAEVNTLINRLQD